MENFKKKFIDTAYSKFGVKANESINFEQAFAIIDEIEQCNIANVVVSEAQCEQPRDRLIMCGDMQTMFKCGKCGKDLSEH